MLLEFKVENYLSFKENNTLDMLASNNQSTKELSGPIIKKSKYNVLSSAAIYGANASGKSNFLKAIHFMKNFLLNSARESQVGEEINVKSFRLNSDKEGKPSLFEMTFIVPNVVYQKKICDVVFRYGFEVSSERIHAEWLFGRFTAQESLLFSRVLDDFKFGPKFGEGKRVHRAIGSIRKTTLFLSLIAAIKGENAPITNNVMTWFQKMVDLTNVANNNFYGITADLMDDIEMKKKIIQAFCLADICVESIDIERLPVDPAELPEALVEDLKKRGDLKKIHTLSVKSQHLKYNEKKERVGIEIFDFDKDESDGSKKFFTLIGPILDALRHGLVIIIDEIDARLHPALCNVLISLFNSKKSNMNCAQLIFATHNTQIMNRRALRRDQIYFIEKDKYGESELYSLLDYSKVRNDASYAKDYLLGKYGAVPFLGNFENFIAGDEQW